MSPIEDCPRHGNGTTRRAVVMAGVVAIAGCLGDDAEHEPVDLSGGVTCDVCGMVIEEHFGPAAQAFYDEGPLDRDGPMRFDSVIEMVQHDADVQWTLEAAFATDYSGVDFEVEYVDDTPYLPTVVEAEAFVPVGELFFAVDSDVQGAMGPDAIPFLHEDDAASFVNEHGGSVVEWDDLVEAVLDR